MKAFADICSAVLQSPEVYSLVSEDFHQKFGDEMLVQLMEASQQDFTKI